MLKALGQNKMQDGRRERSWGLHLAELDREWFNVLLELSVRWGDGGLELCTWKMSLKI